MKYYIILCLIISFLIYGCESNNKSSESNNKSSESNPIIKENDSSLRYKLFIKEMISSDEDTALHAINMLVAGKEQAIPYLIEAMSDNNWRRRNRAADILGRLGSHAKKAVPVLTKGLAYNLGTPY